MQNIVINGPISVQLIPDKDLEARMRRTLGLRLANAGRFITAQLKSVVSRPYPPASLVGEPPRLRTGRGRAAIQFKVGDGKLTVNLNPSGIHMMYLERYMGRPWFLVTVMRNAQRLIEIMRGK